MNNEPALKREITGSLRAEITGNLEDINGPLYAINWFDTRLAFVYHFYNLIAAPRVFRVGAKVMFKGKCGQTVSGDPEMARKFLLIVNYPSGTRFMDLLADRIFQLTSIFRIMAVKQFSFVFHQRKEIHQNPAPGQSFSRGDCYAVVHLSKRDGDNDESFSDLDGIAASHSAEIFFAGNMTGQVVLVNKSGKQDPMPFITDRTVLLKTADQPTMGRLFESAEMQKFLAGAPKHFASYIKRTM